MNSHDFINAIKSTVVDASVKSVISNLERPPGRKPSEKLIEISEWFNGLGKPDKDLAMSVIKESVETAVFGLLCVLDGVRSVEENESSGSFELYFIKDGIKTLINDPEDEYLHDLFN